MTSIGHLPDLEKGSENPFRDSVEDSEKRKSSPETTAKSPSEGEGEKEHNADEEPLKDYDARASPLWSVYMKEAESHDKALIETWKDDMEGVIIFAGLYSASLTAFLVESYQQLQPNSADQSAVLLQQTVTLLAQISQQLAPNGSSVNVTMPSSLPEFVPTSSSIRVNIFWFMSLVFSLTAALAATIVQQWVRDYMQVFVRYNDPLKRARVRQFLYEGAWNGNMAVVVECVPALIHVSLFLFFIGLADFLFAINYDVAVTTTSVIAVSGALYIACMASPVFYAQSPYQTPLSGIFWWITQWLRNRHNLDDNGSERKSISGNMTDGRVQLAMYYSDDRKARDARAIVWVIDNLTEDSELEPFVAGIPGSIDSPWGKDVWMNVADTHQPSPESTSSMGNTKALSKRPSSSSELSPHTVKDLSSRINRLLKTCTDPGILGNQERWKRARACIDAALSLVLGMKGKTNSFLDQAIMAQALVYLGRIQQTREKEGVLLLTPGPMDGQTRALADQGAGYDSVFAAKWTCMTIMSTRQMLQGGKIVEAATKVIAKLAAARAEKKNDDEVAAKTAGIMDKQVAKAWEASSNLHKILQKDKAPEPDKMEQILNDVMKDGKELLSKIEYSWNVLGWADEVDEATMDLVQSIMDTTGGVLAYLPGAAIEWPQDKRKSPTKLDLQKWMMPHLLPARLLTQRLWLAAWNLRGLAATGWTADEEGMPKSLVELSARELELPPLQKLMAKSAPFKIQLWRLQDIRDGGMAFAVDLFVTAFRAHTQIAQESHALFRSTLETLTADRIHAHTSQGTQKYLVALLQEMLPHAKKQPDALPRYILDPMIELVADVLEATNVNDKTHVSDAAVAIRRYLDVIGEDKNVRAALNRISPAS